MGLLLRHSEEDRSLLYRIGVYLGKSVDMDEDFEIRSNKTLEERYDLVKEFDWIE